MYSSRMYTAHPLSVCLLRGRYMPNANPDGCTPWMHPSPCGYTPSRGCTSIWRELHTCENIILPATSFTDSNKVTHYNTTHHCLSLITPHQWVGSEVRKFKQIHGVGGVYPICNQPSSESILL